MIRVHKPNGVVVIDGKHKNLAFLAKKRFVAQDNLFVAEFDYSSGIAVIALEDNTNTGMYGCSAYGNKVIVYGSISSTTECYLFGNPMLAMPAGRAGLKIYSQHNQELVYDSRLAYLNIIGVCQPNMTLDRTKKLGMLFINPVYNDGFYDNYLHEHSIENEHSWKMNGNILEYWHHDILGNSRKLNTFHPANAMPPLLVDLTNM